MKSKIITAVVAVLLVGVLGIVFQSDIPARLRQSPELSESVGRDGDQADTAALPVPLQRATSVQRRTHESISAFLAARAPALSDETLASVEAEVDTRFEAYLHSLDIPDQRREQLRSRLIAAYGDILAFGAGVQRGDITAAEAASRTDPNYVVNQLAEVLSAGELTALGTYLEEEARQRFQNVYAPQLEVVATGMDGAGRAQLLETLFTETYLLVNENGIGTAANLELSFQRQLDAIRNTRQSLRASLSPQQFAQANLFLTEQEKGLQGAQTIFATQ